MASPEIAIATAALPLIDLNRDRREERRLVRRRSRRYGAAILAAIAAAGALLVPLTLQTMALRRELRKSEGQAKGERVRLKFATGASMQLDGQIRLWELLGQTQQSRRACGATFPSLAACLPQNVSLHQVQISSQGKDVQIQLQGSAGTIAGLRAFINDLQASPMFARVHLDEAMADNAARRGGLSFRITGPITTGAALNAP